MGGGKRFDDAGLAADGRKNLFDGAKGDVSIFIFSEAGAKTTGPLNLARIIIIIKDG